MREHLTCFACEREPTQQCPRCGRPYCDEHGEELCDVCLQPVTGLPSFTLYRGSILALFLGGIIAVWLLVQPPNSNANTALRPVVLTPTPSIAANANQTPQPNSTAGTNPTATNQTPTANQTPGVTTTAPAGTATVRPATTGTPAAGTTPSAGTYTVVSGDTLSGICSAQRPNLPNTDCVASLRSLNSLTGDALSLGQQLRLP